MEIQKYKTLLVVPNVNLVNQMYSDFESYGMQNIDSKVRQIYSGQVKLFDNPCSISTWQSIMSFNKKTKDQNILELFDCIIIDESHLAKGQELQKISKLCVNAQYRFGFSGTYPDPQTTGTI